MYMHIYGYLNTYEFDICVLFFFFFKQKTAYEMRISDWSSDVCSSDLVFGYDRALLVDQRRHDETFAVGANLRNGGLFHKCHRGLEALCRARQFCVERDRDSLRRPFGFRRRRRRSEEHTSELQSLMRISYAVFCLKQQKLKNTNTS